MYIRAAAPVQVGGARKRWLD